MITGIGMCDLHESCELLLSSIYRLPWKVKEVYSYKWGAEFQGVHGAVA